LISFFVSHLKHYTQKAYRNSELKHTALIHGLTPITKHDASRNISPSKSAKSHGSAQKNLANLFNSSAAFSLRSPDCSPAKFRHTTNPNNLYSSNFFQEKERDFPASSAEEACDVNYSSGFKYDNNPRYETSKYDSSNLKSAIKPFARSVSRDAIRMTGNVDIFANSNTFENTNNNARDTNRSRDGVTNRSRALSRDSVSQNNFFCMNGPYNPITNPLPFTIQNPYILKEMQKGAFRPRSAFVGVMPDNTLIGGDN